MKAPAQYVVFLAGSGLGAAIDYGLTLALVYGLGLDVTLGLAVAMCVSAVTVFLFHDRVTFQGSEALPWGTRLARFLALALAIFALRAGLLWLTEGLVPVPLQLALALGLVSVLNFALSKVLVFRK